MKSERNQEIVKRHEAGETLQSIGDDFALSRERIRRIILQEKRVVLNNEQRDQLYQCVSSEPGKDALFYANRMKLPVRLIYDGLVKLNRAHQIHHARIPGSGYRGRLWRVVT